MDLKQMYREIVNEHNLHPSHKFDIARPTKTLRGVNPSCGDDINLQLEIKDGIIVDGSYNGSGCAISQASADMMLDLIIGESTEKAKEYSDIFMKMINNEASDQELEILEEAAALEDISHMPARVKCAVLSWRTLNNALDDKEDTPDQ